MTFFATHVGLQAKWGLMGFWDTNATVLSKSPKFSEFERCSRSCCLSCETEPPSIHRQQLQGNLAPLNDLNLC